MAVDEGFKFKKIEAQVWLTITIYSKIKVEDESVFTLDASCIKVFARMLKCVSEKLQEKAHPLQPLCGWNSLPSPN